MEKSQSPVKQETKAAPAPQKVQAAKEVVAFETSKEVSSFLVLLRLVKLLEYPPPCNLIVVQADDGTDLFPASCYRPLTDLQEKEDHELSFEGQGLKLNCAADAAEVAQKIREAKNMNVLTMSGNTVRSS